jgi:hypothetical protein
VIIKGPRGPEFGLAVRSGDVSWSLGNWGDARDTQNGEDRRCVTRGILDRRWELWH